MSRKLKEAQQTVNDYIECYSICLETVTYALINGMDKKGLDVGIFFDCADISKRSAGFILRNSEFYKQIAAIAADVCTRCAKECQLFEDKQLEECAKICLKCAKANNIIASSVYEKHKGAILQ